MYNEWSISLSKNNKITTLGIFAHANAGKTTLTEQILKKTNVISEVGRVDKGNTVTDFLEVEKNRGITIRASYVTFNIGDINVQLIDTPGHVDFCAEVIRAINVLDVAILVISGVENVEVQTKVIWNMLRKRRIPTFFYINKLDRVGASYKTALDSIREILTNRVVTFVDIDDELNISSIKEDKLIELYADINDDALEYYLGNVDGNYDDTWYQNKTNELIEKCKIYPVLGGSALKDIGVNNFLRFLESYIPYKSIEVTDKSYNFSGYVYMVRVNNNHKETYIKILNGVLRNRMQISHKGTTYKITNLFKIEGNNKVACRVAQRGEIAVVHGLDIAIGEIIGESYTINNNFFSINPMFRVNISPSNPQDIDRFRKAIAYMYSEDPLLNMKYNKSNRKYQIDLMGELQGESTLALLEEKYEVKACLSQPQIIYKETSISTGHGAASYTYVSYVSIRVVPQKKGSGISVHSVISESVLHKRYLSQVLRLIHKYLEYGLYGWELTDILVEVIDAKWDSVGSKQLDFNIATPIALARAIKDAGTKLLEPIMEYTITLNKQYFDKLMTILIHFKNTTSEISAVDNKRIKVVGDAYISEIDILSKNLKRLTSGDATLEYYQKGYSYAIDEVIHSNELVSQYNPYNEQQFVVNMGGSSLILDKGIKL